VKIKKLLRLFHSWCDEHREASTARHYRSRLKSFRERFGKTQISDLKPLDLEEWLTDAGRWPDGEMKSPDTRRANIVAWQRFQSYLVEHKILSEPILDKIEKPRGNHRTKIPTAEETRTIMEAATPEFRQIYQALRRTGARPGELASALIADWHREKGLIVLTSHKTKRKTGKDRLIAVGEKLEPLLLEAISEREEGPIFLSPRGKQWKTGSLSQVFRRIRDEQGLSKDLVLYLTRHEHATQLCEKLGIHAAAEALGHANLQTTKRYVKTDPAALRRNQDTFEE